MAYYIFTESEPIELLKDKERLSIRILNSVVYVSKEDFLKQIEEYIKLSRKDGK
jgi:hypothetical protein